MVDNLITIRSLGFRSHDDPPARILHDVSLSIRAGERVAVIGSNGSGKTTLLRLISGDRSLKGITEGSITYCNVLERRPGAIGFVHQRPTLFPWLRTRQNIGFGMRLSRATIQDDRKLDEHIGRFGCSELERKFPVHLSGGETQRVALAQALYPCPTLLLLDEPFSAMDAPAKTAMVDLLRALWSEHGFTVVFIGHDFRDVLRLADRILVLGRNARGSFITKELHVSTEQREDPPYIKEMLWAMSEATTDISVTA